MKNRIKLLSGLMVGALLLTGCSTSNNNEKKEAYYPKTIQKEEITNTQEYKDLKEKIHNFKENEEVKGTTEKVKSGFNKLKDKVKGNSVVSNDVVVAPLQNNPYNREDYPHWSKGALLKNTREEILKRDGNGVSTTNGKVKSGVWNDPYSGYQFRNVKDLDIDHIFPLKRANNSGAYNWSTEKKEQFANDPENLLAVSGKENRAKGAKGPSEWLPSNSAYHKEYCEKYLHIAQKYGLTITQADMDVINNILNK